MDSKELKNFTFINCICCGAKISADVFDTKTALSSDDEDGPNMKIWKRGVVAELNCGYGSSHDCDVYYLGICDKCIEINVKNARLRYVNDYMYGGPIKFSEKELGDIEKKRNRENNLNDLNL